MMKVIHYLVENGQPACADFKIEHYSYVPKKVTCPRCKAKRAYKEMMES